MHYWWKVLNDVEISNCLSITYMCLHFITVVSISEMYSEEKKKPEPFLTPYADLIYTESSTPAPLPFSLQLPWLSPMILWLGLLSERFHCPVAFHQSILHTMYLLSATANSESHWLLGRWEKQACIYSDVHWQEGIKNRCLSSKPTGSLKALMKHSTIIYTVQTLGL